MAYKDKSFTFSTIFTLVGATTFLEIVNDGVRINDDLLGDHTEARPLTLHIGTDSWSSTDSNFTARASYSATVLILFSAQFVDGNTYAVSITTTEPGAPQSLTASGTTASQVTLNWSAPSSIGGSAIAGYKYRYKASRAGPRGWAGPNLLATIVYEKYGQHQTLNRQSERYAREGVELSISTLADQVGACTFASFERFALGADEAPALV